MLKAQVFNNRVVNFIFYPNMRLFAFPVENNFSEVNKLSIVQKFPFKSPYFEE